MLCKIFLKKNLAFLRGNKKVIDNATEQKFKKNIRVGGHCRYDKNAIITKNIPLKYSY